MTQILGSGRRRARGVIVACVLASMAAGCGKTSEPEAEAVATAGAPALNTNARDQAITMISDDLNLPLRQMQTTLTTAASDGRIGTDELWLPGSQGSVPIDWWLWNKGYLRLVDDPYYGVHFALSAKGEKLVQGEPITWLSATPVGDPRMECQSAGSVTSASCSAVITYDARVMPNSDLGAAKIPQSKADLQAVFAPGQGWSVSGLSVEGDTPADVVRLVVFGTPELVAEPRERFLQSLGDRIAALRAEPDEAAPATEPVAAARTMAPATPRANKAVAAPVPTATPAVITNPSWRRQPDAAVLSELYPQRALDAGVEGRATMICTVSEEGLLRDCQTTFETPPGMRFGQATMAAARHYQANPRLENGVPVGGARVSVTINWRL